MLPAAGRAERLQPLTGSKEMLELGGRPMLDYAVERLRAAPADEVRIVVRPEKRDVVERAELLELTVVEATPPTLAESVLAGIAGLEDDDVVLLDLPDSIWTPIEGFSTLIETLSAGGEIVLAVFPSTEPERGDVVELTEDHRVLAVHPKSTDPPGDLIWGAVAARVGALRDLRNHSEPGHLFDEVARGGQARAVRFPGEFIDIGTKKALESARALLD